jgi:fibronectin type 3 domain-containing protein
MLSNLPMKRAACQKLALAFIFLFSTLLFSKVGLAAQIRLAWDANTEPDVAGYKIYYGTSSESYSGSVDVGNVTSYHLTGLQGGQTYYVTVTAYNTSGSESGYSGEASGVATETTLPASETPPTVSTTPTSEPTTSSETTPRQIQSPPSVTAGRGGGGG